MDSDGFRTELARELGTDARDRFLRYVRIDTQSDPDSGETPSTAKQLDLSRVLVEELKELGLDDAELDDRSGIVYATLPSTVEGKPTIGLLAHVDTSFDVSGANVKPQLVRYGGGDHPLPGDPSQVLSPDEWPELANHVGHEIVTTDGTTLLGADDKAGVAEIIAALAYLTRHPEVPRGTLRIAFTPDEEVGRGVDNFDLERFGAVVAYTLDGQTAGEVQEETFSALEARVKFHGRAVHPGYAKDIMVNAIRLASDFVTRLPKERAPETTEEREGFIHPTRVDGDAENVEVRLILRDHDEQQLQAHADVVRALAAETGGDVELRRQYRNMKEFINRVPNAVALADEAVRRAGLEPLRKVVRGGTDGSRLSELGLPSPNIFTGGQQAHSQREWVCVADMGSAAETIVHLAQLWAQQTEGAETAPSSSTSRQ